MESTPMDYTKKLYPNIWKAMYERLGGLYKTFTGLELNSEKVGHPRMDPDKAVLVCAFWKYMRLSVEYKCDPAINMHMMNEAQKRVLVDIIYDLVDLEDLLIMNGYKRLERHNIGVLADELISEFTDNCWFCQEKDKAMMLYENARAHIFAMRDFGALSSVYKRGCPNPHRYASCKAQWRRKWEKSALRPKAGQNNNSPGCNLSYVAYMEHMYKITSSFEDSKYSGLPPCVVYRLSHLDQ